MFTVGERVRDGEEMERTGTVIAAREVGWGIHVYNVRWDDGESPSAVWFGEELLDADGSEDDDDID